VFTTLIAAPSDLTGHELDSISVLAVIVLAATVALAILAELRLRVSILKAQTAEALSRQVRGLSTSSGTDSALITPNEVASGGVVAFRVQSARTRIRLPDML
jgi:hypothetical protein